MNSSLRCVLVALFVGWPVSLTQAQTSTTQETTSAPTGLKLPALISDGMVLQREMAVPLWGWAKPGEAVQVKLGKESADTTSDAAGKWLVKLQAPPVGGPYEMTVTSAGQTLVVKDVMVGEVWVCSGQSNMEWAVRGVTDAQKEIEQADFPQIRHFAVQKKVSPTPCNDCTGKWLAASPQTVAGFTAVGYFFGRDLHQRLKMPIGLIHTSWGGTPAESWTPLETLQANPNLVPMVDRDRKAMEEFPAKNQQWLEAMRVYEEQVKNDQVQEYQQDAGNVGLDQGWAALECDLADWKPVRVPGMWQDTLKLDKNGAFWFRKEVNVPELWQDHDLRLKLGAIDDFDVTYFNGVKVGGLGKERPDAYQVPRSYLVPAALVKPGKNVIAVRVFDHYVKGGFAGSAEEMTLQPEMAMEGAKPIPLAGEWKYRVELALDPTRISGPGKKAPGAPMGPYHPNRPACLYNAMIAPLVPYGIRGAIWYQGESNAGRAEQYRTLLPAMIASWRDKWNEGDFPFLIVQLANFMAPTSQPGESEWAELREAQALTTTALSNVGLAVAIDIGDAKDIHPKNKQEVGRRLALAAMGLNYGQKIVGSGPVYDGMKVEGDAIRLSFKTNVGLNWENVGNLVVKGDTLKGFALAGEDKKFVWAEAKMDGQTVVVKSAEVAKPVAVRYNWANNPDGNLYNAEGLPAAPFRTDAWPGLTTGRK